MCPTAPPTPTRVQSQQQQRYRRRAQRLRPKATSKPQPYTTWTAVIVQRQSEPSCRITLAPKPSWHGAIDHAVEGRNPARHTQTGQNTSTTQITNSGTAVAPLYSVQAGHWRPYDYALPFKFRRCCEALLGTDTETPPTATPARAAVRAVGPIRRPSCPRSRATAVASDPGPPRCSCTWRREY